MSRVATPRPCRLPTFHRRPSPRVGPITPAERRECMSRLLPLCTRAFPDFRACRRPHLHFRGLLRIHSRYDPRVCWRTQGALVSPGLRLSPPGELPSRADDYSGGSLIRWSSAPSWRTENKAKNPPWRYRGGGEVSAGTTVSEIEIPAQSVPSASGGVSGNPVTPRARRA